MNTTPITVCNTNKKQTRDTVYTRRFVDYLSIDLTTWYAPHIAPNWRKTHATRRTDTIWDWHPPNGTGDEYCRTRPNLPHHSNVMRSQWLLRVILLGLFCTGPRNPHSHTIFHFYHTSFDYGKNNTSYQIGSQSKRTLRTIVGLMVLEIWNGDWTYTKPSTTHERVKIKGCLFSVCPERTRPILSRNSKSFSSRRFWEGREEEKISYASGYVFFFHPRTP